MQTGRPSLISGNAAEDIVALNGYLAGFSDEVSFLFGKMERKLKELEKKAEELENKVKELTA